MLRHYSRHLTGKLRTDAANKDLGYLLAFIAGAVNAGGFLAIQKYTSHMTGIVSSMADFIAIGQYQLALIGLASLSVFICGAAITAILINFARRHAMGSEYAAPLMLEAALLMTFAVWRGPVGGIAVIGTVLLLCFIMGVQNAVITKVSGAVIRTTHVTGIVTDIGIELGKLFYKNIDKSETLPRVIANRERLKMLSILLAMFFIGGVVGAFGFKAVGSIAAAPLALVLIITAVVPVFEDITSMFRKIWK